ncbi:cytochrome P450 [Nocardioides lianchengensis]|nr:cytochrome P450 [Nocardioides lianchengensis]NYG10988.1 cytochrome P450 [Nocardioides lianchengensis]
MTTSRALPAVRREDRGLPVLGRHLDYARDPMALFRGLAEEYGAVAPMRMLGRTAVVLLGPDACQVALTNRDKAFANGPAWSELVGPFFRRGLMLLDFEEHHTHRRIMQQAFTRDRLETYVAAMRPAIAAGTAHWEPRPAFAAYPAVKQLTLDIAADVFMGGATETSRAEMERVNRAFVACVQSAGALVRADLPFTRWRRAHRGRRVLEDFLRHYLPAKRATRTDDLFSQLCHLEDDEGARFTDQDVVDHMVFLMMAAHDTSTITLSTMLQLLGQHPEWQERCRAESEALGPRPDLAGLDGLTALDLVMRESLRLRAPVPVVVRRTVRDTVVLDVRIPAGTTVVVTPQYSHLMPELWSDPTAFDPERFAEDRREDRSHRFAWEPFGGGVHKCLGLHFAGAEVKAAMHHLLRHHQWRVAPGYQPPIDNHSLPFPSDGQPIDLQRRPATERIPG